MTAPSDKPAVRRHPTLKKAPAAAADNIVAQLADASTQQVDSPTPEPTAVHRTTTETVNQAITATPRGPGRPRKKIRREPFSTKISIDLRDRLDAYLDTHPDEDVNIITAVEEGLTLWLEAREADTD